MTAPSLPHFQTVLGVDFGLKRIGLAIGQTITGTATPLQTLQLHQPATANLFDPIIQQWKPDLIILGHPLNQDQTSNELANTVKKFAAILQQHTGLTVHLEDEHLSSHEAQDILRQQRQSGQKTRRTSKSDIDKLAAALILQRWLNRRATL